MKQAGKLFAIFLLFILSDALSAERIPETIVRIALLEKVSSFNLGGEGNYWATDLVSGTKQILSPQSIFLVKPSANGIVIGAIKLNGLVRISPKSSKQFLRANGKRYRDTLLIKQVSKDSVTVINELGLEGYLYGILPMEVSPNWPMESLKAQAVVSRTFAVNNLSRHDSEGFDLCSKVHCQVYGGIDIENEQTNQAVDETQNEVLVFENKLANTVFFSNCGGRTEDPRNAWETNVPVPYLKPTRCRYCKKNLHYRWEITLSQEEIANVLNKKGYSVQLPIHSIRDYKHGQSGRSKYIQIKYLKEKLVLRASHFRMAVGPEKIRSTLFSQIRKCKGKFYFKGRGWGHGVGLCQEGAKGLAEKGANYKKILKYYYAKTHLEKWDEE